MRILFAATALVALAGPALADAIVATARVDGTLVATENSSSGTLNVVNQSFGPLFNLNTLSINSESFLSPPDYLKTNTLDVAQSGTGSHQLVIDILATGLTGPNALQALLSEFSITGMTSGWTASEATFINGAPLSSVGPFSGNSASADVPAAAFLGNTFSAEVKYTINSTGTGSFNGGADISAAVPSPTIGAGIPGALGGMVMFGLAMFKRRRENAAVA